MHKADHTDMTDDVDHLGLRVGDAICLRYVLHGQPVSDAATLISHHSQFAVLDEIDAPHSPST